MRKSFICLFFIAVIMLVYVLPILVDRALTLNKPLTLVYKTVVVDTSFLQSGNYEY